MKTKYENSEVEALSKRFPKYSFVELIDQSNGTFDEYRGIVKSSAVPIRLLVVDVIEFSDLELGEICHDVSLAINVNHPNMVATLEYWVDEHLLYIVLEDFEGDRMDEFVNVGRVSLERTLELSTQLSEFLEFVHTEKLYHCGIRPESLFVGKEYILHIRPLYWEKLFQFSIEDYKSPFIKRLNDDADSLVISDRETDIHSLGAIVFYLSTGYPPCEIPERRWCRYGLDPDLEEAVSRAIERHGYRHYTSVSEFGEVLEKLHSSDLSVTLGKGCIQSKLHHFNSSKNWNNETVMLGVKKASDSQIIPVGNAEEEENKLLNDRYKVGEWVESGVLDNVFEAKDTMLGGRKVWVHLFGFDGDADWSYEFRGLAHKLSLVEHPHLSQTIDSAVLQKSAYISTQMEDGERLGTFSRRHRCSSEDIAQFCMQLCDALRVANEAGFDCHTLSMDSVAVYRHPEGGYYFRVLAMGGSQLLKLSHSREKVLDLLKSPTTLSPELYLDKPQGFQTTQFIFGSLIFSLLANGHPLNGTDLNTAYYACLGGQMLDIRKYRSSLPRRFSEWLGVLMHPDYNKRFTTPVEMRAAFDKCLAS